MDTILSNQEYSKYKLMKFNFINELQKDKRLQELDFNNITDVFILVNLFNNTILQFLSFDTSFNFFILEKDGLDIGYNAKLNELGNTLLVDINLYKNNFHFDVKDQNAITEFKNGERLEYILNLYQINTNDKRVKLSIFDKNAMKSLEPLGFILNDYFKNFEIKNINDYIERLKNNVLIVRRK